MDASEKELIIDLREYKKDFVTRALESGVRRIIVPAGKTPEVHKLGKISTIAEDGDLVLGKDFVEIELKSKSDEDKIVATAKNADVLVKTSEWKIIPLENLVSKSSRIYASGAVSEIPMLLSVLEVGVKGVIVAPKSAQDIIDAASAINKSASKVPLQEAEVTNVKVLYNGDRCCIDTCSLMGIGEGMLVGSASNFLFLVNSETVSSNYCDTRPFRVNAGPVHSYVLMPGNKTNYLGELASGTEVLLVNHTGETRKAIVGRNKIEERPLLLVEAKIGGKIGNVVLQNAETIRLVQSGGKTISVTELKAGDKVFVKTGEGARHFGAAIKEKIKE
jgi:3-dehydroquinate synthase II